MASFGVLLAGFMIKWAGFDDAPTVQLKEIAVHKFVAIKITVSAVLIPIALFFFARYSLNEEQQSS